MRESTSIPNSFLGKQILKQRKCEAKMNRISDILINKQRNESNIMEQKELTGLLYQDTYQTLDFTESHRIFKVLHNNVFTTLIQYVASFNSVSSSISKSLPVFYLDGTEGFTTQALLASGFNIQDFYIANIFPDTVTTLRDIHGVSNTFVGRAEDVLSTSELNTIPFVAYYLDGCGGNTIPIIAMIDTIFSNHSKTSSSSLFISLNRIALGFTLTNAYAPGDRSLIDREQDITRHVAMLCRNNNYFLEYIGDDPLKYGLESSPQKRHKDTQTTWLMLCKQS